MAVSEIPLHTGALPNPGSRFEADVYGPEIYDLSGARTAKHVYAQHLPPPPPPLPANEGSTGFYWEDPAVTHRAPWSATKGSASWGSCAARINTAAFTYGPPGDQQICNCSPLLRGRARWGTRTAAPEPTGMWATDIFIAEFPSQTATEMWRNERPRFASKSADSAGGGSIRAKMTDYCLSRSFVTERARRNLGTGFTQQTT